MHDTNDRTPAGCGNAWFIMAAAMWEGWKGRDDREAQPVLYASEETLAYAKEGEKSLVTWSEPMGDAVIPLFTAPPAPAVNAAPDFEAWFNSPEAGLRVVNFHIQHELQLKAWSACRTAMLNHVGGTNEKAESKCECSSIDYCENCLRAMLAQPVSSGYKLPDGWIACSERMPASGGDKQTYVLAGDFKNHYWPNLPNTQVGVYGDWFNDGNPTWDDGDGNDLHLKEVTHWMPLPAAPDGGN